MSRSLNNYTDERFAKLSEKISQLQNIEVKSPRKMLDIDTRIDNFQIESLRNLKDMEFKIKYLEDELHYITKILEDSIYSKTTLRNKINNEIKETENKIKQIFDEEKETIIESNLEIFRNFENEFLKIQEANKKEKLNLNSYIENLRDNIESDIGKLKNDSGLLKDERLEKFSLIVNNMKDEFKYLNDLV